jgi:hypothetical protein
MSKEQQELLDEVYQNYVKWWEESDDSCNLTEEQSNKWLKLIDGGLQWAPFSQEEFIDKCKTDTEFSEKWGLKIEERELCKLERINVAIEKKLTHKTAHLTKDFDYQKWCDEQNIPTKQITITYNDKTIESYEQPR